MSFRKRRGINLPYKKQGLIAFVCLNYYDMPTHIQNKINEMCIEHGGGYSAALFEFITTENSATAIAMKYYIDETVLYRLRKRFYEAWD